MGFRGKIALLACYVVSIFTLIPLTRAVTNFLRDHNLLRLTTAIVFLFVLGTTVWWMRKKTRFSVRRNLPAILPIMTVYAFLYWLIALPEERVHLVQYGILPALFYETFRQHFKRSSKVIVAALVFSAFIGAMDEYVQHLVPRRYGQWSDVQLNVLSALMGMWVHYVLVIRPRSTHGQANSFTASPDCAKIQ